MTGRAENLVASTPQEQIEKALAIARQSGSVDGDHHKAWVIDQMVRALIGEGYEDWVSTTKYGEDGIENYAWSKGTSP